MGETDHITVLKTGADYPMWAKEIKHYFQYKAILDVVDGSRKQEAAKNEEDKKKWLIDDGHAINVINSTIEKNVKRYLLTSNTSQEMFDKLKTVFEQDNDQQKCNLLEEFYGFKYNPQMTALDNVSNIQTIAYRLNVLGEVIKDENVILKVVTTLPDEWRNLRSSWDATPKDMRTITNLLSRLQNEEKNIVIQTQEEKSVCYNAETYRSKPKSKVCFKCSKPGHYQRFCPENRQYGTGSKPQIPCGICKKTNHREKNCHFGPGGKFYSGTLKRKWQTSQKPSWRHQDQNKYAKKSRTEKGGSSTNEKKVSKHGELWATNNTCIGELCAADKTINNTLNISPKPGMVLDKTTGGELCASMSYTCNERNCQKSCCINAYGNYTEFCLDSGCTDHMTDNLNLLQNPAPTNGVIKLAKKEQTMKSLARGDMATVELGSQQIRYVPDLNRNLLSVSKITEQGKSVLFTNEDVQIIKGNPTVDHEQIVMKGYKIPKGLFVVNLQVEKEQVSLLTETGNQSEAMLLHRKLGHMSMQYVKKLTKLCNGINVEFTQQDMELVCEVCQQAKQTKNPHVKKRERATELLKLIHADVCGPISPTTYDGKRYFLIVLDDFSHFCALFLMQDKSEAFEYLKRFVLEAENFLDRKVHIIRCDNGGEFKSKASLKWAEEKGINFNFTVPYCPQLNGKSERLIRTVAERMRALLFDSKMPAYMWGEAALTSAYLINRSPTSTTTRVPAEIWFKKKQDLSQIHLFGSTVYAKVLTRVAKLQSRSRKGIFLGYTNVGARLWDPEKKEVFISRDNVFTEVIEALPNPASTTDQEQFTIDTIPQTASSSTDQEEMSEIHQEQQENETRTEENEPNQEPILDSVPPHECEVTSLNHEHKKEQTKRKRTDEENLPSEMHQYSLRKRESIKRPSRFQNYIMEDTEEVNLSYRECEKNEKWYAAIMSEKNSLEKNRVWDLVDRKQADGKTIIESRWVFVTKDDGTHKARLVAKGFQQNTSELNYEDIFSPVVDFTNLRVLFALAAQQKSAITSFDVKTAFLNGSIDQEIFMELPEGYSQDSGKICKLNKALYGLKQAPLRWYKRLTSFLHHEGLHHLKTDKCIFKNKTGSLLLAIHVDDGLIFSTNSHEVEVLLFKMKKEFEIKTWKNPSTYLGIQIRLTKNGISLHQTRYTNQVLKRFKMEDSKGVTTPMVEGDVAPYAISSAKESNMKYSSAVGSLIYLTSKTRPDLTFSVNSASRRMTNYTQEDIVRVKRILRYVKKTSNMGIHFSNERNTEMCSIQAYSDADFAGSGREGNMKSTTGYVILYAGGPISWNSTRQGVVATCTAEAEYISAAECCKRLNYLSTLFEELKGEKIPSLLLVDNMSAIALIKNGQMGKRTKHIDVRYYYISEKYDEGLFSLRHCPSGEQIADIFTKPLSTVKFTKFRNLLCSEIEEKIED